jgi:hypothetical protein
MQDSHMATAEQRRAVPWLKRLGVLGFYFFCSRASPGSPDRW